MEILFKELSYQITGCVFDVFREIGPGFDEFTYHQGLKTRFEKDHVPFQSKPHISLYYRDHEIAELEPDFVVDDKVVLELKEIQTEFLPENFTQLITYLRTICKRLGILINFGLTKAVLKRVPFDERPLKILENSEEVLPLSECDQENFWRLRDSIVAVANELRLGYRAEIYREAMKVELKLAGFECDQQVRVPVRYEGVLLSHCEIDYWLVNHRVLLAVLAGSKEVRAYDVMRMRSYLKKLNLNVGLIAFWGKDHLKILGVGPMR